MFYSGGFDGAYAPFSCCEVSRLWLDASMLLDQVVSDTGSTIIASMYQAGWDDCHLERDAPNIGRTCLVLVLVFILLVFQCYYCPGMRSTLESLIDVRVDILEALKESFIEWQFQQRQRAKCIASQLNMIDINWNVARWILANKAQRWKSKFELGRLHFESGSGLCGLNLIVVEDKGGIDSVYSDLERNLRSRQRCAG